MTTTTVATTTTTTTTITATYFLQTNTWVHDGYGPEKFSEGLKQRTMRKKEQGWDYGKKTLLCGKGVRKGLVAKSCQ